MITVVIPTIDGREEHLERCLRGYEERTVSDTEIVLVKNAPTCGLAWQAGVAGAHGKYLHFTADDIVPGENWDLPMIESVQAGGVPVAGVVTCTEEVLDAEQYPLPGNPRRESHFSYFEDQDPVWKVAGLEAPQSESYYPSIPFCSWDQWQLMGPMVASHYGTDKWFGHRAKKAGFWPVTVESVFYHYTALAGRIPKAVGWLHLDRLNFDLNVAYPEYVTGKLAPHETHPLDGTSEGRQLARDWYAANVGQTYWE